MRFVSAGNWSPNGGPYFGTYGTWVQPIRSPGTLCGVAVSNPQGFDVAFSNAADRFISDGLWSMPFGGDHGTFVAPVGDGVADLIAVSNSGVLVRFQNGLGWGAHWSDSPPSGNMTRGEPFYGSAGTYFADVTGDGEAEAISVNAPATSGKGIVVRRMTHSNGAPVGFADAEVWSSSSPSGNLGTFFADVSGDGRADVIAVNGSSPATVTVRRSSGTAFGGDETWYSSSAGELSSVDWVLFADTNGDRAADLIYQTANGVRVIYSDATKLNGAQASSLPNALDAHPPHPHGVFACDVTGDGLADLLFFDDSGIQVYKAVK